jgi:malate dehydrogenase
MLLRTAARALCAPSSRLFSSSATRQTKVAILGAGGGIGQPLSLLLKSNPLVTSLSLYDIRGAPGVAADVGHINTNSEVAFTPFPLRYSENLTLTDFRRFTVMLPISSTTP